MGGLIHALKEREPVTGPLLGAFDGEVTRVTAKGIFFILPDESSEHEFGPAPWQRLPTVTGSRAGGGGDAQFAEHDHDLRAYVGDPPKGTSCLVAFVGGDEDRPRIIAIYGWPQ